MNKYIRRNSTIRAEQIDSSYIEENEVVNVCKLTGSLRKQWIVTTRCNKIVDVNLGDWVTYYQDGEVRIVTDDQFKELFVKSDEVD